MKFILFACVFLLVANEAFCRYGIRRQPKGKGKGKRQETQRDPTSPTDCNKLMKKGQCEFYTRCVKPEVGSCKIRDEAEKFCNVIKGDKKLNGQGKKFLREVRSCLMRNMPKSDVISCTSNDIDTIFSPSDIKSDCVYQNVTLCSVLSNKKNAKQLVNVLAGQDDNTFRRTFVERLRSLSQSCNRRARGNIDEFISKLETTTSPTTQSTPESTTSTITSTTTSRQNNVPEDLESTECVKLSQNGDCDFYSQCLNVGVASCYTRDQSQVFCRQTVKKQNQLDGNGQTYIQNVRECLMSRQLNRDVVCDSVEPADLLAVVRPNGQDSDCLFQNGDVCTVLSKQNNADVIRDMFTASGSGQLENQLVGYLAILVEGQCPDKVKSIFRETLGPLLPSAPTLKASETDGCAGFKQNSSCKFFPSCLSVPTSDCPVTSQIHEFCINSENKQTEFNERGSTYIENVRRCQITKLLKHEKSEDCKTVDGAALETLTKLPGCLWQNGEFCKIVSTEQNCVALFHTYGLGGQDSDIRFKLFLTFNQLASQCQPAERDTFTRFFSQKFLSDVQNNIAASTTTTAATTTPTTTTATPTASPMMMMGRNGD